MNRLQNRAIEDLLIDTAMDHFWRYSESSPDVRTILRFYERVKHISLLLIPPPLRRTRIIEEEESENEEENENLQPQLSADEKTE